MNRTAGAPWMNALLAKNWIQSPQLGRFLFIYKSISVPFRALFISRGASTESVPFRPSGGAVDIVVVQQREGGLKCSPWYVRFGRFQGLLQRKERVVGIAVNGVETDLRMYLNTKGQVYFLRDGYDEENSENQALDTAATTAVANQLQGGAFVRRLYRRRSFVKRRIQTLVPTSQQLESLNLREGRNNVTFTFMTRFFGKRQIDAGIYLMPWNSKIVVSDVDGTITRSDVLGQVMPLFGQDWSQSGVTTLFSAIKENGYKLMFLSSRAISQAYRTRKFITELDQNGIKLPDGPVVISPDGVFPSLYREVVRRMPHQFKIACLQEIRSLFPPDYNPFYAGFGNRDTDVVCYVEVGIPIGKIFTINPQGKLVASTALDVKCYVSLHKLVDEMFPRIQ